MTRYARIEAGVVAELLETAGNIADLFPPNLLWTVASAAVQQGWTFDGTTLSPPVPPPFNPQDDAIPDLTARTDRMQVVVTVMETDYLAAGDTVNAAACVTLKNQLDALASDAALLATNSRQAFNTAARTKLRAIAQSAPAAVRIRLARDPSL